MKTTQEKIEVMQAFLDGKRIRFSQKGKNEWARYDAEVEPIWNWGSYDFKVVEEPQYVPFDYSDNLLGKAITDGEFNYIIIKQDAMGVGFANKYIFYSILFNYFTQLDGSPCGKLK